MAGRRRGGRPRLEPQAKRKFRVQIAVNLDEYRKVKRVAEAADLSVSAWARDVVLAATRRATR